MICVSLAEPSFRACLAALETAILAGAAYVDVEADAPPAYRKRLIRAARKRGCRIILSSHSNRRPPAAGQLALLRETLFRRAADIVKIVHRAESAGDCLRLLALYETPQSGRVIALGTGRAGVATRLAAPFTYASFRPGRETAEGQLDWRTLDRILKLIAHERPEAFCRRRAAGPPQPQPRSLPLGLSRKSVHGGLHARPGLLCRRSPTLRRRSRVGGNERHRAAQGGNLQPPRRGR